MTEPYHFNDPRPQGGSASPLNIYPQPDGSFWVQDRLGYLCTCSSWLTLMRLLHAARDQGTGRVDYSGARELLFPGSNAEHAARMDAVTAKLRKPAFSTTQSAESLLAELGL